MDSFSLGLVLVFLVAFLFELRQVYLVYDFRPRKPFDSFLDACRSRFAFNCRCGGFGGRLLLYGIFMLSCRLRAFLMSFLCLGSRFLYLLRGRSQLFLFFFFPGLFYVPLFVEFYFTEYLELAAGRIGLLPG